MRFVKKGYSVVDVVNGESISGEHDDVVRRDRWVSGAHIV